MNTISLTLAAMLLATTATAQGPASALAPTGTLRAAINFGNGVLAQRAPNGTPGGVSVALATELARRLAVPLAIIPFEGAGLVTEALPRNIYDIAFLAIDPVRGQGLDFTKPYVLIEGGYAVRTQSPLTSVESVDAPGIKVAVAKGSAYDLYLTRALKHATLSRASTGNEAAAGFLRGENDVLAGVKQPVAALVAQNPTLRMIPGRFMSIEQAMATPKNRDPAALATLQSFIAEMKSTGFIARTLAETGQHDAEVAP